MRHGEAARGRDAPFPQTPQAGQLQKIKHLSLPSTETVNLGWKWQNTGKETVSPVLLFPKSQGEGSYLYKDKNLVIKTAWLTLFLCPLGQHWCRNEVPVPEWISGPAQWFQINSCLWVLSFHVSINDYLGLAVLSLWTISNIFCG